MREQPLKAATDMLSDIISALSRRRSFCLFHQEHEEIVSEARGEVVTPAPYAPQAPGEQTGAARLIRWVWQGQPDVVGQFHLEASPN